MGDDSIDMAEASAMLDEQLGKLSPGDAVAAQLHAHTQARERANEPTPTGEPPRRETRDRDSEPTDDPPEEPPPDSHATRDVPPPSESAAADPHPNSPAGGDFDLKEDGQKYHSQKNIRLAIAKLGIKLRYNLMSLRSEVHGMPDFGPDFGDAELDHLWLMIDEQFQFRIAIELFRRVVEDLARRDSYHPVREYLSSLRWDGEPRLDGWLTTYAGVAKTDYTVAVGNLFLIAAVRRVRDPGCKFDEMPVLESEAQGKNKSSALRVLAVRDEWFTDQLPLGEPTRTMMEATGGRWIIECGELRGMTKTDEKWLKNYLAAQSDHGRPAYARKSITVKRQFVVCGTTNETEEYLADHTGNRRFWPVRIEEFDIDKLKKDRDHLWAEAAHREAQKNVSIRLDPSLYDAAAEEQEDRRKHTPFELVLAEALRGWEGTILTTDTWRLAGIPNTRPTTQQEMTDIGRAMKALGWKRHQRRLDGTKPSAYTRGKTGDWICVSWDKDRQRWKPEFGTPPPPGMDSAASSGSGAYS